MLTEQRKLFIENHLKLRCKNATEAAIQSGYSPKTASSQASTILKDPEVSAYLEKRKEQMMQELQREFLFDALEARKVMHDILNKDVAEDKDRINVAKDFLDRAGFKAVDKAQIEVKNNPFEGLTTEDLKKLIRDG